MITLCRSIRCPVIARCTRNLANENRIRYGGKTTTAVFNGAAGGPDCPGFIAADAPDWRVAEVDRAIARREGRP